MKYLVVSDIHGVYEYARKIDEIYTRENPDKIILLGDLFYNNLSSKNNNVELVYEILNKYSDIILCTNGNCDTQKDYEKCKFKFEDNIRIVIGNKRFFFTHGDKYNIYNIPDEIDILVYGHYHQHYIRKKGNILCVNPGSLSMPRGYCYNSYLTIDDSKFTIKDIEGNIIDEYRY